MNKTSAPLFRASHLSVVVVLAFLLLVTSSAQGKVSADFPGSPLPAGPLSPEESMQVNVLSQFGGVDYSVAVSGSYAFVGIGPRLVILDISNPKAPVEVGKTSILPAVISDVALYGDFAFVADSEAGVRVIDISNKYAPEEIGYYDTPGYAYGVTISGTYAYVADYHQGLRILDISSPANPSLVGYYVTAGYAWDVAISGKFAYVACNDAGLRIINIGNPASPAETGYYNTLGYAYGVAVSGDYAYLADATDGLRVIYIKDPANPSEVGYYDTPGYAYDVILSGSYAFVADGGYGLRILNISTPSTPTSVGYWYTPGSSFRLVLSSVYVYVADTYTGMRIIDVTKLSDPYEIGYYDLPGFGLDVAVAGSYAYIADATAGLRVVNISNPVSPVMVGFYDTPGYAKGVFISGSYAYVADYHAGLRIINISNPPAPTQAGFYDSNGYTQDVVVFGNYAYLADSGVGLRIIDVTNKATPVLAGTYTLTGDVNGVAVSSNGNYVYVAEGSSGLRIINVSNPALPVETGFYDTAGYAQGVVVSGSYAYVADGGSGLRIINISNPAVPLPVGSYDTPGYAYNLVISGNYAYIADDSSGLRILNISNPASPALVGSYDTSGYSSGVAVASSYVYLADTSGGFLILQACLIPEAPILVAPANGSTTNDNTPYFDWNPASFASQYIFELDDSNNFSNPGFVVTLDTDYFMPSAPFADHYLYWRVRGVNSASGCSIIGNPSSVWTFTIDTTPPPVPTLSSPSNGSSTSDTTPTFIWNSSSGASNYQVQVDNDIDFSSPIFVQTTPLYSFTPVSALSLGTYYWRVRAQDPIGNWSTYSAPWSVIIVACNTPGTPELVDPVDGSSINTSTPLFDWKAASDSSEYQIQVDDNSDFSSPQVSILTLDTAYAPGTLIDKTYYWHVRGHNTAYGCDIYGPYSVYWTVKVDTTPPAVPTLSGPSNGYSTINTKPIFTWSISTGATTYQIQIDNDSNFSSTVYDQATAGTSFSPVSPLPLGTYYWHVRAKDAIGNWSAYSTSWTVTIIACSIPGTPVLVSPTDGSIIIDNTPLFDWKAASDSSEYEIQVDDDNSFTSPAIDMLTIATDFTPTSGLSDLTYYWRVRGYNTIGGCDIYGPYSAYWVVSFDTIPPLPPVLSVPSNGSSTDDSTPTFSWNTSDTAVYYEIQVDNNSNFSSAEIDEQIMEISFTPSIALPNGSYSWRVRARDAAGNWGNFSNTWSVTINSIYSIYLPMITRLIPTYFEGPAEVEDNDIKETANGPIRAGSNYTGAFEDNSDYFYFNTSATGTIFVVLDYTGNGDQLKVSLQLYNDVMEQKGYAPGPGLHLTINEASLPAGRYYVRVYSAEPGAGSYTLSATYP